MTLLPMYIIYFVYSIKAERLCGASDKIKPTTPGINIQYEFSDTMCWKA